MTKGLLVYWITTIVLFLYQGVLTALTAQTEMARESITHRGYLPYLGTALSIAKALGTMALILPQLPKQVKEWAYAGFFFDFVFACISLWGSRWVQPSGLVSLSGFICSDDFLLQLS